MRFFTNLDLSLAVAAMLAASVGQDTRLLGTMSGIKRRARARAVISFLEGVEPAPPDRSITTMRSVLQDLFGQAVSNRLLLEHFGTPGRKADDRVDLDQLGNWLEFNRPRLEKEAGSLVEALELEWHTFTHTAARRAGEKRRSDRPEEPSDSE